MVLAACLQSSSLSRAFLPSRFHRTTIATAATSSLNCSGPTARRRFSKYKTGLLASLVRAHARRGFASKMEEVASKIEEFASVEDLQFESPLRIVEYPDPRLRARNKRIETFDHNLKKLVDEMFVVMYKTDGYGLSAPQVGVNVQLMVFNPSGEEGEGQEIILVNPKVNKYSEKTGIFKEGCLSFPGIFANVVRPESITIDAQDIKGARFTVDMSGLTARIFQHEFDHLQGVLFFDKMTDDVLASIRVELKALEKKFEDMTGRPSPEKIEKRKRRKAAGVGFGKSRIQ